MTTEQQEHGDQEGRLRGRSIRVDDPLWTEAQEAARWRGEPNLSLVIRRLLQGYVRETKRRQRNGERGAV